MEKEILIFILNSIGGYILCGLIFYNKKPKKYFLLNLVLLIIAISLVKLR